MKTNPFGRLGVDGDMITAIARAQAVSRLMVSTAAKMNLNSTAKIVNVFAVSPLFSI